MSKSSLDKVDNDAFGKDNTVSSERSNNVKEVQEYFMKHNMQMILEQALNELVKNKVEKPFEYLAEYFHGMKGKLPLENTQSDFSKLEKVPSSVSIDGKDDQVRKDFEKLKVDYELIQNQLRDKDIIIEQLKTNLNDLENSSKIDISAHSSNQQNLLSKSSSSANQAVVEDASVVKINEELKEQNQSLLKEVEELKQKINELVNSHTEKPGDDTWQDPLESATDPTPQIMKKPLNNNRDTTTEMISNDPDNKINAEEDQKQSNQSLN